MNDLPEMLKKNWPYVVGGIIGLYLVWRFMSGGSASGGDGGLSAYYAAQAQQQAAAQSAAAQAAQIQAEKDIAQQQYDLGLKQLQISGQTEYLKSQAQMAQAVGDSAAKLVGSLYTPTIAAMQSAAYENAAALTAASQVAAAGFISQQGTVQATSDVTRAVSDAVQAWGPVSEGIGSILGSRPGAVQTVVGGLSGGFGGQNYLAPIGGSGGSSPIGGGAVGNAMTNNTWSNLFSSGVGLFSGMFGG